MSSRIGMRYQMYRQPGNRKWRWRLWSANNKVIARSDDSFFNKSDCARSIALTKSSGDAPVVEEEEWE